MKLIGSNIYSMLMLLTEFLENAMWYFLMVETTTDVHSRLVRRRLCYVKGLPTLFSFTHNPRGIC